MIHLGFISLLSNTVTRWDTGFACFCIAMHHDDQPGFMGGGKRKYDILLFKNNRDHLTQLVSGFSRKD